ncbi:type IV pilus assembly protein PilF [Sphaerotilus hippei]|uniref:Type IV pilus assembly protein PilF n=1 Tax=Sphaerotilus hippei TaxID=744406 RepID=A0A318H5B0_9BURK|nr:type IV pilus assembly protein PilF [Sphaerotilus hippei]
MEAVLSRLLEPVSRRGGPFVAAALVLLLSACVSSPGETVTSTSLPSMDRPGDDAPAPVAAPSGRPDLVTASDESPAARRARIRLELASAYFSQGQTTTALDEVKRALVADPESVAAFNLRGLIYASLGDHGLAQDSFRRALQLRPDDADTLHNYGWYLCQQRRFSDARTQLQAALRVPQYGGAAKTLLALGLCESRAGEPAAAERQLMRSYELDPGNPSTAVNLSDLLMRRGELDRALFYVRRVNQRPELASAETLWLEARIERRRGATTRVQDLGAALRERFPASREAAAMERGQFDE